MTIDEATTLLSDHAGIILVYKNPNLLKALTLGIAALKRVKDNPIVVKHCYRELLPGETKQ